MVHSSSRPCRLDRPAPGLAGAFLAWLSLISALGCGEATPTQGLGGAVDGADAAPETRSDAGLATPDAGDPLTPDAGLRPCGQLGAPACSGRADCLVVTCPLCPGQPDLEICRDAFDLTPPCPRPSCPPTACGELTADACAHRDDCEVQVCSTCDGTGERCVPAGTMSSCPRPDCSCNRHVEDEEGCIVGPDCHANYVDETHLCDCVEPDCHCARYVGCSEGPAPCTGPEPGEPFCTAEPPPCEASFLIPGVSGGCWTGCVRIDECGE